MGLEEYLLPAVTGAVAGGATGTMAAGPVGTIPGVVIGAIIGLLAKNLVFLLLIIPVVLAVGVSNLFNVIPWYVWATVVVLGIVVILKKK